MPEEKKGRVKITIEAEINEPLMEIVKESITKMPQIVAQQRKKE